MQKCLDLAILGLGEVSPNPLVGCLIVHNATVIGSGYHQVIGGAHAEVNAIASVKDKNLIKDSIVYVNLEPCSHYGKTPPCANLLIDYNVKKVVIGMSDPFPEVAGKGIKLLEAAGIEVECGVLEKKCMEINRRFLINQLEKRPYIILKWATSKDGFMAGKIKQISGITAQTRLHKWRSEEDAFLIGTNTLLDDNPALSNRLWRGKNPVRIAVDYSLKSNNKKLQIFDRTQETIILNGKYDNDSRHLIYKKIRNTQVETIVKSIFEMGIGSVVVEGGSKLIQSFLDKGLYDEIRVFQSKNITLESGIESPKIDFLPVSTENLIEDLLLIYR